MSASPSELDRKIPGVGILQLVEELPLSFTEEPRRILQRSKEIGLNMFDLRVLPKLDFIENESQRSSLQIDEFFWEDIKRGKIDKNSARTPGVILLVDHTNRPNYVSGGMQMYDKDPLGPMLAEMRKEGKVTTPPYYKGIDPSSRFAISVADLSQNVFPEIASRLGLEDEGGMVRSLTTLEYTLLSNNYYSWKGLNTHEWTSDKYENDKNLTIGNSTEKSGTIGYHRSGSQALTIGFRVAIAFPL